LIFKKLFDVENWGIYNQTGGFQKNTKFIRTRRLRAHQGHRIEHLLYPTSLFTRYIVKPAAVSVAAEGLRGCASTQRLFRSSSHACCIEHTGAALALLQWTQ
jgi:hypothetical protein